MRPETEPAGQFGQRAKVGCVCDERPESPVSMAKSVRRIARQFRCVTSVAKVVAIGQHSRRVCCTKATQQARSCVPGDVADSPRAADPSCPSRDARAERFESAAWSQQPTRLKLADELPREFESGQNRRINTCRLSLCEWAFFHAFHLAVPRRQRPDGFR